MSLDSLDFLVVVVSNSILDDLLDSVFDLMDQIVADSLEANYYLEEYSALDLMAIETVVETDLVLLDFEFLVGDLRDFVQVGSIVLDSGALLESSDSDLDSIEADLKGNYWDFDWH